MGISLAGAKYHVSELPNRLNLSSREEIGDWYRKRRTGDGALRRFGFAPIAWTAAGIGSAAAAAMAVVAIALGSGGGDASVSPVPTATPAIAQPAGTGGFLATGSPTIEARAQFTTTLLADGQVLLAGGASLDATLTTELYDPTAGTFTPGPALTEGRRAHEAIRLADGRVLLIGGLSAERAAVLASTEIYDPADDGFRSAAAMNDPRWNGAAVLLSDERALITGGVIENGEDGAPTLTDHAELYDPVNNTFAATGAMNVAGRSHSLTRLDDGRILVSGGGPLEVYNPATGEFSLFGGEPVFGNEGTVATRLTDGRVLIAGGAGGYGQQTVYPPSEIFDPVTGRFELVGLVRDGETPSGLRATNVATHLGGNSATALEDGTVLLVGSIRTSAAPALVAERFDPAGRDGGDRVAAVGQNVPPPKPTPGRTLESDYTGMLGTGGMPFNAGGFVAATEAQGLQLRELPGGLGMCGAGAEGRFGQAMRAERTDGSPGAEDFVLYVYTSPDALAVHWLVDDEGIVRANPGTTCDDAFDRGQLEWARYGLVINQNQLLIFDLPALLGESEERDPEIRTQLIAAFQEMPEPPE